MATPFLSSLRSVEIGLPDVAAAEAFFTGTWNLRVAARQGEVVYLRGTGADHHLLALHPADKPELRMVTLRAPSLRELDQLLDVVPTHGGSVLKPRHSVSEPGGGEAIIVRDPQGRVLRIVTGDARHADTASHKDSPIRLAHAVLNSHDVAQALPFYENALGMRLSDRTRIMAFIRIPTQPRGDHHSIALADADNDCLNHIAFVMPDLEAVMRGGGRMKDAGYGIEWGPGRHGPGNNSFNYFVGPAGFVIEYTADVEQIDDAYPVRGPEDWKWPAGRVDHWGISAAPSARLKEAQKQIAFANYQGD
ncbi:VOC family protein [uncultured Ramlibacter sp.]|uniref:VOC family protein n=1 Tax=uncultured Ramlibacter sp. TaxID=260755 RepID=UPI002602BA5A|nr:VOC family protein [uncultured Ramlibacter sp.]